MNRTRKVSILVMLIVLASASAGVFFTRGVMEYLPFLQAKKGNWTGDYVARGVVDQRPWQTAATLAALAQSAEEKELAREAERLADHEVDQAFSQSLRQASLEKPKLSGRALELQQRVNRLQETIKSDQDRIASLSAGTASTESSSNASDLEIAKAQLGLDQNELADSIEDLSRVTGDQRSKIQQELTARQAAMKKYESDNASRGEGQNAVASAEQYRTMAEEIAALRSLHNRRELIAQAEQLAKADVAALTDDETRLRSEADKFAAQASARTTPLSKSERIDQLQQMAVRQNILSILNDRLDTQQQLVALYGRWGRQVEIQYRIVIHLLLQSLAIIAVICVLTILVGWALQQGLERFIREHRQKQTLKTVVNLGTQVVGFLLVLLVIFGVPQQTPTILGLATAGLTLVFQDFILAFCGWFVLMGPNGIRVRDWVEIDGVGGEVVELGIFRTWLLETGNWTAHGHPTGRRVSFLNGYAIRGKYFNFSTVGQWMWDEIKISIPTGTGIHPLVEKIYEATVKATENDAKMAEAEWKRVTHEEGSPQFSAMPSVNLTPAGAGIDIVIRYITRASLRLEKRNRLFETFVDLMQSSSKKPAELPATELIQKES
ncbi:mechanosensitive ion channel domain-containing protein [Edaphobacter aggregans]|uniref:mechanosensitive ion channel domain-containing protein n=1 Tax=Edaphobacter aggregans TaxID=570835 RepID=UPI0005523D46|nr:mechanosensitive ion channel domain-containing protein [Edaphobacter aggregans]